MLQKLQPGWKKPTKKLPARVLSRPLQLFLGPLISSCRYDVEIEYKSQHAKFLCEANVSCVMAETSPMCSFDTYKAECKRIFSAEHEGMIQKERLC